MLFFSAAKDKDGCGSGNDGDDEEDYGLNTGASSKHKVGFMKKWKTHTSIPRFTLLMWGHIKNPRKSRLISSTFLKGSKIDSKIG